MNPIVIVGLLGIVMLGYWTKKKTVGVIFNAMWFFSFLIVAIYRSDFQAKTVNLLFLTVVCTNIAYLFSGMVRRPQPAPGEYQRNNKLFLILLWGTAAVLALYAARTVAMFGFDLSLIRKGNNSDSEMRVFSSTLDTVLFYGLAGSMAHIGPMAMIYEFLNKRKISKTEIFLNLFNTACFLIADAGRMLLVRILLFGVAAWIWMRKDGNKQIRISKGKVVLILAAVFAVLSVMTSSRTGSGASFVQQVIDYVGGSLRHMDVLLLGMDEQTWQFGTVAYGGFLYYPIKILNILLRTSIPNGMDTMFFLQDYKLFSLGSQQLYYNALVPNTFYYYFDSGILGVCLFSLIMGYQMGKYEKAYRTPSFFSYVMFSMCIYAVAYSPLGGIMWNFRMPMVIMISYFISKLVYCKSGGITLAGNTNEKT